MIRITSTNIGIPAALRLRACAPTMATLARPAITRLSAPRPPVVPAGHAFPHAAAAPPRVPHSPPSRPPTMRPALALASNKRYYTPPPPAPASGAKHATHAYQRHPLRGEPPAGASGSHMNANIPEGLDEALREGKGKRWVEAAASDSEAIVKAERTGKKKVSIKQLQQDTVRGLQTE